MNIIVNGRHLWRLFGALAIMVTLALTQRVYGAAPEKAQVIEGGIQQYQLQAINNFKKSFLEHITQSSDVYINHIKAGLHPRESKRRQLMPLFPLAAGEYLETVYTSQAFFAAALKLAPTGVIEISLQEAYALSQVLGNTNADLKELNKALADLAGCQLNSGEGTTVCEQLKANLEPLLGMDFGATDYIANNILALYNRVAERFHQNPNSSSNSSSNPELSIIEMGHIWRVYFASGHHITLLEDFVTDAVQRKYNYFKREYFNQLGQCENSHCTYSVKEKFDSQLASRNVSAIIERYFSEHQDSSSDQSIIVYRDLSVCQACACACKKIKRFLMYHKNLLICDEANADRRRLEGGSNDVDCNNEKQEDDFSNISAEDFFSEVPDEFDFKIETSDSSRRVFMGVYFKDVSKLSAKERIKLRINRRRGGVIVAYLMKQSPAEQAGLLKNDIVVSIDGQSIDSKKEVSSILEQHTVGDRLDLIVIRGGDTEQLAITVELAEQSLRCLPGRPKSPATSEDIASCAQPSGLFCIDENNSEGGSSNVIGMDASAPDLIRDHSNSHASNTNKEGSIKIDIYPEKPAGRNNTNSWCSRLCKCLRLGW